MALPEEASPDTSANEDFDVAWATELSTKVVAQTVAETVFKKGYCIIQMESAFEGEEYRQNALMASRARTDWTLPKPEFECAFLGYGSKSKVAWLDDMPKPSESEQDPLLHYTQRVGTLSSILLPAVRQVLGFRPGSHLSGTLLRMPLGGSWEDRELEQEALSEEEVRKGWVEKHLDFVQRRRLCMLYTIDSSGGTLELYPKAELNEPPISLPISRGKLLVFRHDVMAYSYMARGYNDLILQSWFMEQPQQLQLGAVEGDQASFEAIFGGPPQEPKDQVHVMSAHGRIPGRGYKLEHIWPMVAIQTDAFREIPYLRWDMSAYYTAESGQFSTSGKSVQKHAGLLQEEELMAFDNRFFNISKAAASCISPSVRLMLETSFELLCFGGHTKQSLQGAHLYTYVADCGLDWDAFYGHSSDPKGWLEAGASGSSIPSSSRLGFALGVMGPIAQVDTACSASLVAASMLHAVLATRAGKEGSPHGGIAMAHQNILQPWGYIGLSAAGMIGRSGRCRTFDISANGFARGEGSAGVYLQTSTEVEVVQNRLCSFLSSYINQDGRSASLTAPNGPSQQACIRGSLRQGNLDPLGHSHTENHGTGTALGDPIETGSICAVFRKHEALPVVTHKTLTGHLECCAGAVGLLKVIVSLINSTVPSNNHLRELNANMAGDNSNCFYPNGIIDIPQESAVAGLNAFGFGGTNSRAELWSPGRNARTFREVIDRGLNGLRVDKLGPAALLPRELQHLDCVTVACTRCQGEMCWLCGDALPPTGRGGKHYCRAIREEFASYEVCSECYEGGYLARAALAEGAEWSRCEGHGHRVYVVGSWDAWASFEAMEELQGGRYVGRVVLGDTCLEHFHFVVDQDSRKAIFPVAASAGQTARVLGPQPDNQRRSWALDGRREGSPSGTVYEVVLNWEDARKAVSWRPLEERLPPEELRTMQPRSYALARRSRRWRTVEMERSSEDPALWEWRGTIGKDEEAFHVLRDGDPLQRIRPPLPQPSADEVVGPCPGGEELGWEVLGQEGDEALVRLRAEDGRLEVSVATNRPGEPLRPARAWCSLPGPVRDVYCLVGPGAEEAEIWGFMASDEHEPDVHRFQFSIGGQGHEEFHVLANGSRSLALFPASDTAAPGTSSLRGPGENAEDCNWQVTGPPGLDIEVVLNLAAEDRCAMLTCVPLGEPVMRMLEVAPPYERKAPPDGGAPAEGDG